MKPIKTLDFIPIGGECKFCGAPAVCKVSKTSEPETWTSPIKICSSPGCLLKTLPRHRRNLAINSIAMKPNRHKFNPSCPDCQREKKLRRLFAGAKKALLCNVSPENVTAALKVLRAGVDDIIAEKKEKQE